ncbi:hypothetical protein P4U97_11355 [Bacillus swezeyi]|uniref:hypothetical protein n=1 Tax=Bacillus swezeyi TaxID=1925020 RepID=UPI002E221618|nr:hypothetical protein [Bacillus swezeyi]
MKKNAPFILLIVLTMLTALSGNQAEAVTSKGSSGTKASSSSGGSSAKTRASSVNKSVRSYMKQAANRRYSNRSNMSSAMQRTLPSNALYKGSVKQTLNQNPAGTSFFNYYFPYWMIFHGSGYTAEQKKMLHIAGIKEKELIEPKEKRYWLLIEDQTGKEQAVLVSKKQYDSVKKGDHIKLLHKQLVKQ